MSEATLLEQILRHLKPRKVLHVGANEGQEAGLYHQLGIEVWHIEAIPEVFQSLERNIAGLDQQHALLTCLSESAGLETSFHVSNNAGLSSSLLPLGRHQREYPAVTYEREITVKTETIDSLIGQGLVDADIDFILIDAQGAELMILRGADGLLSSGSVRAVLAETAVVPLYEGGATYLEVSQFLLAYELHLRQAAFGVYGWTDALYMKPYWQSANPGMSQQAQDAEDGNQTAQSDLPGQQQSSNDTNSGFPFFLQHESAIAEACEFCAWDKPAFDDDIMSALKLLIPVPCAHELIRIGGSGDGAYLVPDNLDSIEACFSPGVATQIEFEQELADRFSIPSYMCDASVDASQLRLDDKYHHFEPLWLGSYDGQSTQTLDSWIAKSEHADSFNLLLQMDIEGAEYASLMAASDSVLARFRMVVIEFHWMWRLQSSRFLNLRFLPTLHKLSRQFDCVHVHPNNCCGTMSLAGVDVPNVIELTFMRKDCNAAIHQPLIPHPLDVLNIPSNTPIVLGAPWI